MKIGLGTILFIFSKMILAQTLTEPITFEKISALIKEKNIQSIECLLSHMPKQYMEHHMLLHSSRGLQESNFQNPRAIIYGTNAKFVMAFNGDPSQFRYEFLEIMQFNPNASQEDSPFELFEIIFPANKKIALNEADPCAVLPGVENKADLSIGKNPTKCLGCHSNKPSPIFEHYPFMPGAYGENADQLNPHVLSYEGRSNDILSEDGKIEVEEMKLFTEKQKDHPRYRYLENFNYSPEANIPHNGRLQQLFSHLNFYRLKRELENLTLPAGKTPLYKYYFLSIFNRCFENEEELTKYIPSFVKLANPEPILYNIYQPGMEQTHLLFNKLFLGLGVETSGYYIGFDPSERVGFDTATDFYLRKSKAHITWLNEVYYIFSQNDQELGEHFNFTLARNLKLKLGKIPYGIPKDQKNLCNEFKDKILSYVSEIEADESNRLVNYETNNQEVTYIAPKSCVKCHTADKHMAELYIPFDKTQVEFEHWATANNKKMAHKIKLYTEIGLNGKARMPLMKALTQEEKDEYLQKEYPTFIRYMKWLTEKQ